MIHLSPIHKKNLTQILPFGVIWLVIGWLTLWTEYAVIASLDEKNTPETAITITPVIFIFASLSVFLIGCLVGVLEVSVMNRFFKQSSFPKKIFGKSIVYALFLFVVIFVFYMLAASIEMKLSVVHEKVFNRYVEFLFSMTNISTSIQIAFSLVVSLLFAEISNNIGQNVLINFFTGKYHKPVVERRVFMFTDMKDSTSIAEKLGHYKYFNYLRSYYNDLSRSIVNNYGEVYQYIGDEIVISWNTKKKDSAEKSVRCFFDMKKELAKKREHYLKEYGLFPDFKAGLHIGEVTTGEIGALKKDIFFTGDVLNTTARIQGLCKSFERDLLSSEDFISELNSADFKPIPIGEFHLKGKQKKLHLFAIEITETSQSE